MRVFFSIFLVVVCFALLGMASKKTSEEAQAGPYFRRIELLGWNPDSKALLYREDTDAAGTMTSRAVVLDAQNGKLLKEHLLQQPEDGPDIVSVRENNLRVLLEHEGFVVPAPSSYYIGTGRRGFLSPNGQYLLTAKLRFAPLQGHKGLQSLTLSFILSDLNTPQEWNVAQMVIESLDGEHMLDLDSISSVSLSDFRWGPNHNVAAAVIEEKRKDYLVQGIFSLHLENLPDLSAPVVAKTSEVPRELPSFATDSKPVQVAKTPLPLAQDAAPNDLRAFYQPEGGEANNLAWEKGLRSVSPDQQMEAIYSSYRACNDIPLASQVTLLKTQNGAKHEISLSSALDPKGISFDWGKEQLKILFLGESLRVIALRDSLFNKTPRAARAFSIQVGAYASEEKASQQVKDLCAVGLPAYSLAFHGDSSGNARFRVRLGRFLTEEKAKDYAREMLKNQFPKFLVTRF